MLLGCYSVFDLKAAMYSAPFFLLNDAVAHRAFEGIVNDPQSVVRRNPGDYVLHKIGTFDDVLGVLVSVTPVPLATASSVLKSDVERIDLSKLSLVGKDRVVEELKGQMEFDSVSEIV